MAYEKKPWVGTLPEGKHAICTCGESANRPFCDGTHGKRGTGQRPSLCEISEEKKVAICWCGQTENSPFCDGAHSK